MKLGGFQCASDVSSAALYYFRLFCGLDAHS